MIPVYSGIAAVYRDIRDCIAELNRLREGACR